MEKLTFTHQNGKRLALRRRPSRTGYRHYSAPVPILDTVYKGIEGRRNHAKIREFAPFFIGRSKDKIDAPKVE